MALDEQVIGQLDSSKGDATLALGGNIPFAPQITDATIKIFQDLTAKDIAKKEKERADWEKNVATKISDVSRTDGVLDVDKEALNGKRIKLINQIKDKSYLLHPANQMKHRGEYEDLMSQINEYIVEVDKSKQDAVLDKDYRKSMMQKPEWNNNVNQGMYEQWRKTPLSEREFFVPVADPKAGIEKRIKDANLAGVTNVMPIYTENVDKSLITVQDKNTIDKNLFIQALKDPDGERYYQIEYENKKPEEKEALASNGIMDKNDYVNSMYAQYYKPEVFGVSKTIQNPKYNWENRFEYQDIGQKNEQENIKLKAELQERENKIKEAEKQARRKNNPVYALSDNLDNASVSLSVEGESVRNPKSTYFNLLQGNGITKEFKEFAKNNNFDINEVESFSEINDSDIDPKIKNGIYEGGASKHKEAYGKLAVIKMKDPSKNIYLPYKVVYRDNKSNEIDKKLYDTIDKDKRTISIIPDWTKPMSKRQVLQQSVTTQSEREGMNEYYEDEKVSTSSGSSFLDSANKYKDVKYEWGAKGKGSKMDCSGLVCAILNDNGIKVSGTSEDIYKNAPTKLNRITSLDDFREGDVIALDTGETKKEGSRDIGIDHIGIVVEKDGGKYFVESRSGKGYDMTELASKWNSLVKNGTKLYVGRYDKQTQSVTSESKTAKAQSQKQQKTNTKATDYRKKYNY